MLLFLIFFSRNKKKGIRGLFIYCLYAFINDLVLIDIFNLHPDQHVEFTLYSLFTVVEYLLFSLALYNILSDRRFKRIILLAIPIFLPICAYQFYRHFYRSSIDSITITVEYIFLIAFCMLYFFEELNRPNTTFIYSSYKFLDRSGNTDLFKWNIFLFYAIK